MQAKICDKRAVYGVPISDRIYEDNNGQLIIYDAILARTGSYDYRKKEIFEDVNPREANDIIKVYRTPEEVFDPASMASFEHKPFCDDHPDEDVSIYNWKDLQKGYVFNIRRGKGDEADCLIGDIVVMDPDTIDEIKNNEKRELSLGYNTEIVRGDDGNFYMTNIRGNHLALVDDGRAGVAVIRDSNTLKNNTGGVAMQKAKSVKADFFKRLYDEDTVEEAVEKGAEAKMENVKDEDLSTEPEIVGVEEVVKDDESSVELELLKAILDRLDTLVDLTTKKVGDNDVVSVEEVSEEVPAEATEAKAEPVAEEEKAVTEQTDEDVDADMDKVDVDSDVVEEDVENEELDDCDKPELFSSEDDGDEVSGYEEEDVKKVLKNKDSTAKLYKKFVNVGDAAAEPDKNSVDESFRQRYVKFRR